jgi:aryl-alcohol dehydrogenase-like predicted oxidoreductase
MINKKPYIVPIPGSRKVSRIRENLEAGEIVLSKEEVEALDKKLDGIEMSAVFGGSPMK